ncbi:TetR/AcrR family transcriptional regulator C-terminal domain-containing protein [Microbacterium sp. No. 7]|uniref:TetR/AcrR family transcriptional regulator C-terminal domain-containing protein n=1 Tax=Microbacterium sp. No. 7 TaxID=1714373 RepID=UPI0006CFF0EE|nr:TetR/AcrR family transcriptional regulator C-terminal domain-containing protein [Microbacterium sp. No. 7]ALJ20470.1 hypothetical protein AOA12_11350 [Microbacterium sp. No. 7]
MTRRTLAPAVIVDAAIAAAARGDDAPLSGRTLGDALGVDRSAIWRHFADHDALLRAAGDRLLRLALDEVPTDLVPHERMMALARALVRVFVRHAGIGALVAGRTTGGPAEIDVVELTLRALDEAGVPPEQVAHQQRMIADAVLGYAGMRATQALLPAAQRQHDLLAWGAVYAGVSAQTHPAIAAHLPALAAVTDDDVLESLLAALWRAVQSIAAPAGSATGERRS